MEIAARSEGRWHGILRHLGVAPTFLRNKNGPCPACGGVDRFRFDDKGGRGTFICGGGGDLSAGDGFGLVKHLKGCDFPTAARMVEKALGGEHSVCVPRQAPPKPKQNTSATAERIWQATRPDSFRTWDTEVSSHLYAQLKGIGAACGAARGRVSGRVVGSNADCLIVPMRRLNGQFSGVEAIGASAWNPDKKKYVTAKQAFGTKGVLILGNTLNKTTDVHICEGWADAVSLWKAHGDVISIAVFGNRERQLQLAAQLDNKNSKRRYFVAEDVPA